MEALYNLILQNEVLLYTYISNTDMDMYVNMSYHMNFSDKPLARIGSEGFFSFPFSASVTERDIL